MKQITKYIIILLSIFLFSCQNMEHSQEKTYTPSPQEIRSFERKMSRIKEVVSSRGNLSEHHRLLEDLLSVIDRIQHNNNTFKRVILKCKLSINDRKELVSFYEQDNCMVSMTLLNDVADYYLENIYDDYYNFENVKPMAFINDNNEVTLLLNSYSYSLCPNIRLYRKNADAKRISGCPYPIRFNLNDYQVDENQYKPEDNLIEFTMPHRGWDQDTTMIIKYKDFYRLKN